VPGEVEQTLSEAAAEKINGLNLSPVAKYLEEGCATGALATWARNKFGIEVDASELVGPADEVAARLMEKVEAAYRRREIEYPVEYALDMTVGKAGSENVYALGRLAEWANRKFDAGLDAESLRGRKIDDIRSRLVALCEQWWTGRLEEAIRNSLGEKPDPEPAIEFAKNRFDTELKPDEIESDVFGKLLEAGREFLRREMTELERFVLLQIFDSSWKDHLLAMDHLKSGIGLRGYAEQDPRVAYKREGSRMFQDMLAGAREKITEMIFKVRLAAGEEMASVYQISSMVHEQLAGYDHLAREMAQQAQEETQKVQTIIRQAPKVGRNDPCPCGSGKKYKKCCGKNL